MTETLLDVKGMSCGSCVRHIDGALKRLGGVEQVEVRLREGLVRIRHSAGIQTGALIGAIEDAGDEARTR